MTIFHCHPQSEQIHNYDAQILGRMFRGIYLATKIYLENVPETH